jgi:hypoxanthine phosphoribosyltransferase
VRVIDPSYVEEVLIPEDKLQARIAELGAAVSRDYAGRDLLLLAVLKGSVLFLADLMRHVTVPHAIDFMATSSYGTAFESSGVVRILKDLDQSIEDRDVLIVEDIIDTGRTLDYLVRILRARRPASLEICTLLNKPARREVDVPVKYIGFNIPDKFVLGYGLDFQEKYRNLPYVAVLEPKHYAGE